MTNMSHEQLLARAALVKRLEEWGEVNAGRDKLIREAHSDGMSNTEIAKRMRINRGTVIAALGPDDNGEEGQES